MPETDWKIFTGNRDPHDKISAFLDDPAKYPPWRNFPQRFCAAYSDAAERIKTLRQAPAETDDRGAKFYIKNQHTIEMINAALYLRRPLLITGNPGTGKSSLIYAVARELNLGKVLRWPITSRSTLQQALYQYDAIGRLQEAQLTKQEPEIGHYIRLGALGTALLPSARPRALLIDEIDKSDVDLPNDLLNIFEEGEYEIPELVRLKDQKAQTPGAQRHEVAVRPYDAQQTVTIRDGHVRCYHFPFVVMTSNGDRDFPAPFLRRCLRLEMKQTDDEFKEIVSKHLAAEIIGKAAPIIKEFLARNRKSDLATDQLLNAVFLVTRENGPSDEKEREALIKALLAELNARQSS